MTKRKAVHTRRFGARYGVSVKARVEEVEVKQRKKHICPKCGFQRVKRISVGIFLCTKCKHTYAGGAYYPQTMTGSIISKMVNQRSFLSNVAQLASLEEARHEKSYTKKDKQPKSDEERIDEMIASPSEEESA
jgi:large subunit ribosomal protein L37Ae